MDDEAFRGLLGRGDSDFLHAILDSIEDGIVACDAEGVLRYFNRATVEMHGLPHESLPAELWPEHYSLFHADGLTPLTPDEVPLLRALRDGEIKNAELVIAPYGQRHRRVVVSGRAIYAADGEKLGAVVSMHEITDRHRAEAERARRTRVESLLAELRESERRFRNIADQSPIMLWVTLPDGECVYLNRPWYEFTGQSEATGLGFGWLDVVHPDDAERAGEIFLAANVARGPFRLEYRLRRHDGEYRWCIDAAAPRFGRDGTFLGYVGSVIDISERRQAEEAAREDGRRKDEFLAMLAHELRNPLAAIQSARQLLEARVERGESLDTCIDIIERQTEALGQLVNDLLDVSRVTRGVVELRREPQPMRSVVESSLAAVSGQIEARGHTVELALSGEALLVSGDRVRLEQIVSNLLTNAIKYTPPGGTLGVRLARDPADPGWIELEVRDSGIGIEPGFLTRVFELFEQAERSLDRAQGGLGIGLTVIKYLVELHGGTIEAFSEGVGRGSRFVVRLPAATGTGVDVVAPPPPPALSERGRPLNILIVDDNHDAAETLGELLASLGHGVELVHDGRSAVEHIARTEPQVVLLDIGLPGLDGYQVARQVRASEQGAASRMVLIAVTGYGQAADRERAMAAGFDEHLVKPLDFDRLLQLLAALPF